MASATVIAVLAIPILSSSTLSILGFFIILLAVFSASFIFGTFSMILASNVKSESVFSTITNLMFIVLMFTSSTFYPLEDVPTVFQAVFLFNPLTYVADIIRFGMFGLSSPYLSLEVVVLVAEAFVVFFALLYIFRRRKFV